MVTDSLEIRLDQNIDVKFYFLMFDHFRVRYSTVKLCVRLFGNTRYD